METDNISKQKVKELSAKLGIPLEIKKIWDDEDNPGFYFRFYGLLCDKPLLKIEVVGSYYFGIRKGSETEEIDVFPFITGKRVAPCNTDHYIWHSINGTRWDNVDPGYDRKESIQELLSGVLNE